MNLTLILALVLFLLLIFTKGFAFIAISGVAAYFAVKGLSSGSLSFLTGGHQASLPAQTLVM